MGPHQPKFDPAPAHQPSKRKFVSYTKCIFSFALLPMLLNSAEMESAAKTDVNNWELS